MSDAQVGLVPAEREQEHPMTRTPERDAASGPDAPHLLPLDRAAGRFVRLATLVADVIRAVGPDRSRADDVGAPVRIECDVDAAITVDLHATAVRRLLESLVRGAVAAARRTDPDASTPPLREVVVTAVDTGTALEIEVADSGPLRTVSSIDHGAAERMGASLVAVACAEGGMAVTLSLPRRVAMARAA